MRDEAFAARFSGAGHTRNAKTGRSRARARSGEAFRRCYFRFETGM